MTHYRHITGSLQVAVFMRVFFSIKYKRTIQAKRVAPQ